MKSPELASAIAREFRTAAIEPCELAMLEYADKLTREPWTLREDDVATLRAAGFADPAILHINLTASYYAYVNRIALGLGVPLEEFWSDDDGS